MPNWKIGKQHGQCSTCEHPFEEGEAHYSSLLFQADELGRADFCRPCFEQPGAEGTAAAETAEAQDAPGSEESADTGDAPSGAPQQVVWWRTHHTVDKKKGLALDFDTIEQLFFALEPRQETRLRELRYVLGLLLIRKRRLKVTRILRLPEGEALGVRRPRRKEEFPLFVYDLRPERAEQMRGELQSLFDGADPGELAAQGEQTLAEAREQEPGETEPGGTEEGAQESPEGTPNGDPAAV